jgi:hypothetical protein
MAELAAIRVTSRTVEMDEERLEHDRPLLGCGFVELVKFIIE